MEINIDEGKKKVEKALKVLSAPKNLRISKFGDQAGPIYMKLAKCDYVESEYDIKAPESCISCIINTVKVVLGINRSLYETTEAAVIYEKIANMYYEELNLNQASLNYERSAKIFDREGEIDKAYHCWLKLAQIAAQCADYGKAIEFQNNVILNRKRDFIKSKRDSTKSDLLVRHVFEYSIYLLSVANIDAVNEVPETYKDLFYIDYSINDYMFLTNLAAAIGKGDKVEAACAIETYYQNITHVEDTCMEYHLTRILEQVLVPRPQPQCIVESTDILTNTFRRYGGNSVHFQEIINPDDEIVPGGDFVITRLILGVARGIGYYITKKGGKLTQFSELRRFNDQLVYNCFLVLQGEVEQIPLMKPKAFLKYLEDIIGTNKYVKKIDESLNRLKEVNERMFKAVEMVKLAEKERDVKGVKNEAEASNENLKSEPERYGTKVKIYNERVEQLNLVTQERDDVKKQYDELKEDRLEEFMENFNDISSQLKFFYQMINQGLCKGGNAKLKLVDSLDPFSGVVFMVRPPVKTWKNIANLSGGEKTLSSLALILALRFHKDTSFRYANSLEEVDDFKDSLFLS